MRSRSLTDWAVPSVRERGCSAGWVWANGPAGGKGRGAGGGWARFGLGEEEKDLPFLFSLKSLF